MTLPSPVVESLPPANEVRRRLGDALREVQILRGLLRLAERAERYRERDREVAEEAAHAD
jgi:hypothetical protein